MIKSLILTLTILLSVGMVLQAQTVNYIITLERPTGISEADVLALFENHPEIKDARLHDNKLSLVVPSKEHYPITNIREILATKQITAIDYIEADYIEADSPQTISANVKTLQSTSFMVYGNCGMCKDRIERAARSVKGVLVAIWDEESALLTLKYQPNIVELDAVHAAIVAVGHDTDKMRATDEIYKNLHHCCKYERPDSGKK